MRKHREGKKVEMLIWNFDSDDILATVETLRQKQQGWQKEIKYDSEEERKNTRMSKVDQNTVIYAQMGYLAFVTFTYKSGPKSPRLYYWEDVSKPFELVCANLVAIYLPSKKCSTNSTLMSCTDFFFKLCKLNMQTDLIYQLVCLSEKQGTLFKCFHK